MALAIVGGVGFLGAVLAEEARQRGLRVCVVARRSSAARRAWLAERLRELGAAIILLDSIEAGAVAEALRSCGAAALAYVAGVLGGGRRAFDAHVRAWRAVLDALLRVEGVEAAVYVSAAAVAPCARGEVSEEPEHLQGVEAADGYTASKAEGERLAMAYHRDHGVPVAVARPAVMFGPYAYHPEHRLIYRLGLAGLALDVPVDAVPARDVARAILYAAERRLAGSWFYVARPEGFTVADLSCRVASQLSGRCTRLRIPRPVLALGSLVSARLRLLARLVGCGVRVRPARLLEAGFEGWTDLEASVREYVGWLRRWLSSAGTPPSSSTPSCG